MTPSPAGRPPLDLYVILDPTAAGDRDLLDLAERVLRAGVRWVQLRDKEGAARDVLALARGLLPPVRAHGGVLIVNDRLDVALAAGAAGVHLGQDDLPVAEARRLAPGLLLGASTHDVAQARAAERDGADYLAVGSMYPTASKAGFQLVGPGTLARVRAAVRAPLVAIGGITVERAAEVVAAGADGLAVISAVGAAPDPGAAAAALLAAIRAARARRERPDRP